MLGVALRKLCPQDSFGYAFREKKTIRKSTPGGCNTGLRGVQHGLREASGRLFCASWPPRPLRSRGWAALGALLGRLWRSWSRLGGLLGRPGPLLGASWGSFWDPPRADLDDLDDVCGAT